jgi:hypothetical protein
MYAIYNLKTLREAPIKPHLITVLFAELASLEVEFEDQTTEADADIVLYICQTTWDKVRVLEERTEEEILEIAGFDVYTRINNNESADWFLVE